MPLPKESRYTLADALTWDEHECIELIDGAPVMMAPPSRPPKLVPNWVSSGIMALRRAWTNTTFFWGMPLALAVRI